MRQLHSRRLTTQTKTLTRTRRTSSEPLREPPIEPGVQGRPDILSPELQFEKATAQPRWSPFRSVHHRFPSVSATTLPLSRLRAALAPSVFLTLDWSGVYSCFVFSAATYIHIRASPYDDSATEVGRRVRVGWLWCTHASAFRPSLYGIRAHNVVVPLSERPG